LRNWCISLEKFYDARPYKREIGVCLLQVTCRLYESWCKVLWGGLCASRNLVSLPTVV